MIRLATLFFVAFIVTSFFPFQQAFARCIIDPNNPKPCEFPAMPELVDSSGNTAADIFPGRQLNIQFDIGTRGESERSFVYIVLVTDSNGFTELLSWTSGIVKQNEFVRTSVPWRPEKAEDYTVTVLIWNDLEKPSIFDPMRITTVTVFPLVRIPLGTADPEQQENFSPEVIKVVLGVNNTVVWLNEDLSRHTVNVPECYIDLPLIQPNQTWSHTFTKPAVCNYEGELVWMIGTVIVLPYITEERAIEIAKNAYGEINLNFPIANITANLLYVDHGGEIYEVDKMNLQKQEHYQNALPLPDTKLERDHYYWNVIFLPKESNVGYGSYIIDATTGEIPQGIRLD